MSQISRRTFMAASSGLTIGAATGIVAPARAQTPMMGMVVDTDAYSYMLQDPRLSTWIQLINAGGLEESARTSIYTVFPAADSAFASFPGLTQSLVGYLSSSGTHNAQDAFPDTSRIVKLIRSHVVAGKHFASEVMGKQISLTTLAGTPLTVDATDERAVKISWTSAAGVGQLSATLVGEPITCANAVVYVLSTVEKM